MTDGEKLGNGRIRVTRLHTSKRGRIVRETVEAPGWFRAAMRRMRWFRQ